MTESAVDAGHCFAHHRPTSGGGSCWPGSDGGGRTASATASAGGAAPAQDGAGEPRVVYLSLNGNAMVLGPTLTRAMHTYMYVRHRRRYLMRYRAHHLSSSDRAGASALIRQYWQRLLELRLLNRCSDYALFLLCGGHDAWRDWAASPPEQQYAQLYSSLLEDTAAEQHSAGGSGGGSAAPEADSPMRWRRLSPMKRAQRHSTLARAADEPGVAPAAADSEGSAKGSLNMLRLLHRMRGGASALPSMVQRRRSGPPARVSPHGSVLRARSGGMLRSGSPDPPLRRPLGSGSAAAGSGGDERLVTMMHSILRVRGTGATGDGSAAERFPAARPGSNPFSASRPAFDALPSAAAAAVAAAREEAATALGFVDSFHQLVAPGGQQHSAFSVIPLLSPHVRAPGSVLCTCCEAAQ